MKLVLSFFVLLLSLVVFAQDASAPQVETSIPMDLVAFIIAVVFAVNALIQGFYNALGYMKDKTKWEGDNKAYELLGKVISFLQKVLEFIGPVTINKSEPPK